VAKYPIVPQVRNHIGDLDFNALAEVPLIRMKAIERIRSSFDVAAYFSRKMKENEFGEVEIASFPLAIMYVALTKDKRFIERFSLFEAQRINAHLQREKRIDVILEVARALKWDIKYCDGDVLTPFSKYLGSTAKGRLLHNYKWKLVNRALDKGFVYVTPYELARLIQEDVKKRIEELAKQEVKIVPKLIKEDIESLEKEFNEKVPHIDEFDKIIKAQEGDYPPCITYMMQRATKGEHLSHTERFSMVTYLLHQGISVDAVILLFSNVTDFQEKKTRYQVENLAGLTGGRTEPYTTFNCASLQTHGVCKGPPNPICRKIRNPLTYHVMKQKINPQKMEK
jgi:DNA primase large subunit